MIEMCVFFIVGPMEDQKKECLKQYIHMMWNFVSFTGSSKDKGLKGHVRENREPERKLLDAEAAYMKIVVMYSHDNKKEEGKK